MELTVRGVACRVKKLSAGFDAGIFDSDRSCRREILKYSLDNKSFV